jgi:DNA-binding NarL/FixJ family response regulator
VTRSVDPDAAVPTILLVVADDGARERYAGWLAEEWSVAAAGTVAEVTTALEAPVAAAVVARDVPDVTVASLVATIRGRVPGLPVGVVADDDPDRSALALEPDDFLRGAVTPASLRHLVSSLLGRRYLEPERRRLAALLSLRDAFRRSAAPEALTAREAIRESLSGLSGDAWTGEGRVPASVAATLRPGVLDGREDPAR